MHCSRPLNIEGRTLPSNKTCLEKFYVLSLGIAQEVNTDGDAALDKDEFAAFFKTISTRKEIVDIMKQYSSNGAHMTVEDFQRFLVSEQEVSWPECVESLITSDNQVIS